MRNTCTRFRSIPLDEDSKRLVRILNQMSIEKSIATYMDYHVEDISTLYYRLHLLKRTIAFTSRHGIIQWPNLFMRIVREIHVNYLLRDSVAYNFDRFSDQSRYYMITERQKRQTLSPIFHRETRYDPLTFIGNAILLSPYNKSRSTILFIDGKDRFRILGPENTEIFEKVIVESKYQTIDIMDWIIERPSLVRPTDQQILDKDIARKRRKKIMIKRRKESNRDIRRKFSLFDSDDRIQAIRNHVLRHTNISLPRDVHIYDLGILPELISSSTLIHIDEEDPVTKDHRPFFVVSSWAFPDGTLSVSYLGFCVINKRYLLVSNLEPRFRNALQDRMYIQKHCHYFLKHVDYYDSWTSIE